MVRVQQCQMTGEAMEGGQLIPEDGVDSNFIADWSTTSQHGMCWMYGMMILMLASTLTPLVMNLHLTSWITRLTVGPRRHFAISN